MSILTGSLVPRLSLSLVDVATGLQSGKTEILDLTVDSVCKNALRMVQTRSPRLNKIITTVVPIAFLGYGAYSFVWKPLHISDLCGTLYSRFFAEILVEGNDPLNEQVIAWMASQKTSTSARALTLQKYLGRSGHPASTLQYISSARVSWYEYESKQGKKWLRFELKPVPAKGSEDSWGQKHTGDADPDVAIRCFSLSGDTSIIQDFLAQFREIQKQVSCTYIFRPSKNPEPGESWDYAIVRPSRDLSTVAMKAETKQQLVSEVEDYLSEDNKLWYTQRGLPFRKGILLHGPPGTGRSSLCIALAGHFDLNLYILSFTTSDIDDGLLQDLFDELPRRSLILLEDVDSAGVRRERMTENSVLHQKGVSLSGLLNVIDGAGAAEGRLLIMTSNSANSLDPALVRAGRADHHILMGNAIPEVGAALFTQVYTDIEGKPVEAVISSGQTIEQLADTLASKVPPNALSPAEVQGFLLTHRNDPIEALARFDAWAEKVVAIKSSGRNVEDSPSIESEPTEQDHTPERRDSAQERRD